MTQQYSRFMRWTSRMVILSMLTMGLPLQPAFAGMVETDQAVSHESSRSPMLLNDNPC